MEFIDLATQQKRISDKIDSNIKAVLNHSKYVMGSEVKTLPWLQETLLARLVGYINAVAD